MIIFLFKNGVFTFRKSCDATSALIFDVANKLAKILGSHIYTAGRGVGAFET